jgi:EAL domain-containing protein (putative c-di-GMP-specific phosphodiesterase class I)
MFILHFYFTSLENGLPLPSDIKIAFNIFTTSLTSKFITTLCDPCKPFHFSSSDLDWVVTETSTLKIGQTTKTLITKLRLSGVNLSLDDLGTGYSTIKKLMHYRHAYSGYDQQAPLLG